MKNLKLFTVVCMFMFLGTVALGQTSKTEANMTSSKNIVEVASNSSDHTTLVTAVKTAGLVDVLSSEGPFTVFAPTNKAFEALPKGTVETLLKKENQKKLQSILTYHVLAGDYKAADVIDAIKKGNGKATFKTVNGDEIYAMLDGDKVKIKDKSGNIATVTAADLDASNGVIHVIDTVILP